MQHRRLIFTLVFFISLLTKVGLDYRTDAQIIPLSGGSAVRLAAVISGNLDATLISSLQGRHAEKLGLTVIPINEVMAEIGQK